MEKNINIPSETWESPDGFDIGIEQILIENTLNEQDKTGIRTRFVRFNPGEKTKVVFLHDYHEEVYIISGDQVLLDKET
jgi:hypothetical protein